jgi:hypothetical protein
VASSQKTVELRSASKAKLEGAARSLVTAGAGLLGCWGVLAKNPPLASMRELCFFAAIACFVLAVPLMLIAALLKSTYTVAVPGEVDQLGGHPVSVHRGKNARFSLLSSILGFGGGYIAVRSFVDAVANSNPGALLEVLLVGGPLLVGSVWLGRLAFSRRGLRVIVMPKGLVHECAGKTQVFRWSDIAAVWQTGDSRRFEFRATGGTRLVLKGLVNIEKLGEAIQRESSKLLFPRVVEALNAGRAVDFGVLRVTRGGISKGRNALSWGDLDTVRLKPDRIVIGRKGKLLDWASLSWGKVANPLLLGRLATDYIPNLKDDGVHAVPLPDPAQLFRLLRDKPDALDEQALSRMLGDEAFGSGLRHVLDQSVAQRKEGDLISTARAASPVLVKWLQDRAAGRLAYYQRSARNWRALAMVGIALAVVSAILLPRLAPLLSMGGWAVFPFVVFVSSGLFLSLLPRVLRKRPFIWTGLILLAVIVVGGMVSLAAMLQVNSWWQAVGLACASAALAVFSRALVGMRAKRDVARYLEVCATFGVPVGPTLADAAEPGTALRVTKLGDGSRGVGIRMAGVVVVAATVLFAARWYQHNRAKQSCASGATDAALAEACRDACEAGELSDCTRLGGLYEKGKGLKQNLGEAAALYRKACEGDEMDGCAKLAVLFQQGKGLSRDVERGAALYHKACDGGGMQACVALGQMLEAGEGGAKDLKGAVHLYERACDGGEMFGCYLLARTYHFGLGVEKDERRAVDLARKACDGKQPLACQNLAGAFEKGEGVERNLERASELYGKACDGGEMWDCMKLGTMHEDGTGVARDASRAVELYGKACDGGQMSGCIDLGMMYNSGRGVDKDSQRAAALFRKGCDGGEMNGCLKLAWAYDRGEGVGTDVKRAVDLYGKACDGAEMGACTLLGMAYELGTRVGKDLSHAAVLYGKACSGAEMRACVRLGRMYASGEGVDKDAERAVVLYRRACDAGQAAGCEALGRCYFSGIGVHADRQAGITLLRWACASNENDACAFLRKKGVRTD